MTVLESEFGWGDPSPQGAALLERADQLAGVFAAHAAEADRTGKVSPAAVAALRASGFAALTVPAGLGGGGATLHEFALVQRRLGRADASLALIAAMNGHVLGAVGEGGGWPAPIYETVARAAVTRGALTNALASEPELGSPSRGGLPQTAAVRAPGGWRLTGRKTWSTGAPALDFLAVTAAVGDQVWRFVLPSDTPGVSVERSWDGALALRGSGSHDVVFGDAFVPDARAIAPGGGKSPSGSAWFWGAVAATYLGVGWGALDALVAYARARVPSALGRPIATLPKIQRAVGEIELELAQAGALLERATQAWVRRPETREALLPHLAAAKSACTNAAAHVTDLALRAAGGAALAPGLPLERFFRDARAGLMHPPSDEAALGMLGRARLGEE